MYMIAFGQAPLSSEPLLTLEELTGDYIYLQSGYKFIVLLVYRSHAGEKQGGTANDTTTICHWGAYP